MSFLLHRAKLSKKIDTDIHLPYLWHFATLKYKSIMITIMIINQNNYNEVKLCLSVLSELGQESNSTLFIKTNCLQFKLALCRAKKKEKKRLQFTVCILFWKICLCRVQDNLQTQVCNCIITHVLTIQEKENFPDLEYLKWKSWSLWYAREGHVYLIIYHLK